VILSSLGLAFSSLCLAQEWEFRVKPKGTLKVVDLFSTSLSEQSNYAEGLVTLDKANNWVPCLAEDLKWINNRVIEFKLREGVRFHNGEKFNAEAVRINWEKYHEMERPLMLEFLTIPDETSLTIIDDYTVRFIFAEPYGLAYIGFRWFRQIAPAFFAKHEFQEGNWGFFPRPGPWGTGPFRLVAGSLGFYKPGDRVVLDANERYWDHRYPKVQRLIFENTFLNKREEAVVLCREEEGAVDIVSFIRPLDTLKVAGSPFAKVVKSRDAVMTGSLFNQRKRNSKWGDIRLRKALNYAINREELLKYAARGNAYNLGGYIPPGAYGHNPDLKLYTYDTSKARALLTEAGYPDGFELKIIAPEMWKLEAQIVSKMLERIGLKAELEVLTFEGWLGKVTLAMLDKPPEETDWDLTLGAYYDHHGNPGVTFIVYCYLDQGGMRWIENDPVLEEMWGKMTRTVDLKSQEHEVRQMVAYLYDRAYGTHNYSPLTLYAVNKEVNFVPQKSHNLRLKETSVTEKHWSVRGKSN
jgi:peptide/nickel transport system substrate-binding protein